MKLVLSKDTGQVIRFIGPDGKLHEQHVFEKVANTQSVVPITSGLQAPPPVADVSPNEPNGQTGGGARGAGVIGALAGNEGNLYAIGKNAGVWRSTNSGPWQQLPASPRYAFAIAVDPADPIHIVVGEREGDATDPSLNEGGLWESRDVGNSWTLTYDPFPASQSHRIRAIAFGRFNHSLFIGTDSGVGRLAGANSPLSNRDFQFPSTARGMITAFAVAESRIWARTPSTLLFSDDDGVTWTSVAIPTNAAQLVGNLPAPFQNTTFTLNSNANTGGNDFTSIAAFDRSAYLFFRQASVPVCNLPNASDPLCNRSFLLIYNDLTKQWTSQLLDTGDGRGLGGRRFLKSYVLNCPQTQPVIGDGLSSSI